MERTAEAIGANIEMRQQRELAQALQLNLPIPLGPRIPILYVGMDGTGVPVVRKESEGRAGKQEGQPAHTREVKLGCVFSQTTVNEEGCPVRDEDSTTYVGAIETAEEFGRRLYAEAWRRGWGPAASRKFTPESAPMASIYVNRGLGTVGAPVRLGVPPEISSIVLRRA